MKHIKKFNESYDSDISKTGSILMDPIIDDIKDMLVDFTNDYDIKFLLSSPTRFHNHYGEKPHSILQMKILPKGYSFFGYTKDAYPILVDEDTLNNFKKVINFIESEIGFKYTHSYYYEDHNDTPSSANIKNDILKSDGKLVTVIHIFFKNDIQL